MARILIELEGGLVSSVIADEPIECLVIDLDAAKADQVGDFALLSEGGKAVVGYRQIDAEEDEGAIEHYFNQLEPDDDPEELEEDENGFYQPCTRRIPSDMGADAGAGQNHQ